MRPRYDTVTVTTGFIQSSYWYAVLEQLKVSISFEPYCCIQIDRLNQIEFIERPGNLPQWSILSADDRIIKNPVSAESIKVELLIRTPIKPSNITKMRS